MNQYLVQIIRIYNTLLCVETKGENTIIMSDCLKAMQDIIKELQRQEGENNKHV